MNSSKVILIITLFFGISTITQAQIWNRAKERLKRKVENKVLNKVDREADKKIDDVLDGDGSKRDKKKQEKNSNKENSNQENNSNTNSNTNKEVKNKNSNVVTKPSFKAYSKFDFVSGEKIIAFEDFSQDEIGDLPARWNSSNSAEIVTLNSAEGRWMRMSKGKGSFVPDFITEFPDNFTLEYDMVFDYTPNEFAYKRTLFAIFSDVANPAYDMADYTPGTNGFTFSVTGNNAKGRIYYNKYTSDNQLNLTSEKKSDILSTSQARGEKIHISIWKQKQRMRVYMNETKVFDIPRGFEKGVKVKNLRFYSDLSEEDEYFYIGNLRYAIGKPDVRSKLITEGKLVTYGITFDVNSASIKSSSYGTLKKIAAVLKENPSVKVKIVGHTDSDGSSDSNQSLSEKRAASVKKMLVNEFSVSSNQLSSAGKGESELLDKGSSLESKARNRRVEFLKQ